MCVWSESGDKTLYSYLRVHKLFDMLRNSIYYEYSACYCNLVFSHVFHAVRLAIILA